MSDNKLYRQARQLSYVEGGDLSALIADGALVEVEPTDQLCVEHGVTEIPGRGFCAHGDEEDIGDDTWEYNCRVVDVVRVPKEDNDD